jgi:hypothetical protein
VSVVPVRLRLHVKLTKEEACKLLGCWWDWGVVGRECNNVCYRRGICVLGWCIEEGDLGLLGPRSALSIGL